MVVMVAWQWPPRKDHMALISAPHGLGLFLDLCITSQTFLAVAGTPFSSLVRVSYVRVGVDLAEGRLTPKILVVTSLETEVSWRKEAVPLSLTTVAAYLVVGQNTVISWALLFATFWPFFNTITLGFYSLLCYRIVISSCPPINWLSVFIVLGETCRIPLKRNEIITLSCIKMTLLRTKWLKPAWGSPGPFFQISGSQPWLHIRMTQDIHCPYQLNQNLGGGT